MEWYPWYPQLYQQKTLRLSLAEDGAYRRLIDAYMTSRHPLPDDDIALARLIGIGVDEWRVIAPNVRGYFKAKSGCLWNQRCDTELLRQDSRTKKHSEISKKGAAARWKKNNGLHASGKPKAMPPVSRTDATGQDKTGEDSSEDSYSFDEWYAEYPNKVGRKAAEISFNRIAKSGEATQAQLIEGVRRYKLNKPKDRSYCGPAVWLNQGRWDDEPNEGTQNEKRFDDGNIERGILAGLGDELAAWRSSPEDGGQGPHDSHETGGGGDTGPDQPGSVRSDISAPIPILSGVRNKA